MQPTFHRYSRALIWLLAVISICLWKIAEALADDAQVLPKGVFRAGLESNFYLNVDKRYNPDGKKEDLAVDYNEKNLNSSVFPALRLVETGFGMPAGTASIGESKVSFEYGFQILKFKLQYGVTDRISVGVNIPYWSMTNQVKAQLDPTSPTVRKNPFVPVAPGVTGTIAPLGAPGTTRL